VAQIAAKVPGRILEIAVKAGDTVTAGQVLAHLDERELQAKLNQARAAQAAAEAQAASAGADARRMQNLFDREAATRQMLDSTLAASRSAAARVAEARAAVVAAESVAGETVLRAPFGGAVVKRFMDPGDMALPGQPVLTLQSEQALRVEAAVPESCARLLKEGQELSARIGRATQPALIEEIAPAADPQTRTVLIKAALESRSNTQPGAFAWLEQACGHHSALLIPESAVSRAGQLESVRVVRDGQARLRHVRTGKAHEGLVEILSGLNEGDVVLLGEGK
jgi:RND family efflux transporter MFP subunit